MADTTPTIIVHGGAWNIPDSLKNRSLDGVKRAATKGYKVLMEGSSAVDAVVAAVSVLEDDTAFDAGHGAVLNAKGEIEMDSIVIDGKTLGSGAVSCVHDIANPVQLARRVMEKTDHCLLVGCGANDFAQEQGFAKVSPDELVTAEARAEWEEYTKYTSAVHSLFNTRTSAKPQIEIPGCDTVGAVALDKNGNLASATSTGGITAKRVGRAGDTPIIGAGAYADNDVGAVSTTGHGESIMKVCLARRVGEHIEKGCSSKDAANKALDFMARRVGGAGGVIVISKTGEVTRSFTSERMAWASVQNQTFCFGIEPEQEFRETYAEADNQVQDRK